MSFSRSARSRALVPITALATLSTLLLGATAYADPSVPRGPSEAGSYTIIRNGTPTAVQQALRLIEQNKHARATRVVERALRERMRREDREMLLHVGCAAHTQQGELDAALEYCTAAVDMAGPRRWMHLANRAAVHLRAGQNDLAIEDYLAASALMEDRGIEGEALAKVQSGLDRAKRITPLAAR